jgi:hypothetical protein
LRLALRQAVVRFKRGVVAMDAKRWRGSANTAGSRARVLPDIIAMDISYE